MKQPKAFGRKLKPSASRRPFDTLDYMTSRWGEGSRISYGAWSNDNTDDLGRRAPKAVEP
jgi:hypothetical protein